MAALEAADRGCYLAGGLVFLQVGTELVTPTDG